MTTSMEKEVSVTESFESDEYKSLEVIRKSDLNQNFIDTSWELSHYVSACKDSLDNERDPTPPFMSVRIDESSTDSKINSFTQTEFITQNPDVVDVKLSFSKDFHLEDSSSNDNDTERSSGSKRYRHNSFDDDKEMRPLKKTKCTGSSTSSNSEQADCKALESDASSRLYSESELSFKSINSNYSYKTRKRRLKSDSNLIRDVLQKSRRISNFSIYSGGITSGSPRKEKPHRRSNRTKVWRIMDLCTWIGRKGYQSITGLYSDILRESIDNKEDKENVLMQELKQLKMFVEDVDQKHSRLARENETLHEDMKKMMSKIAELEKKLSSCQQLTSTVPCMVPPPPPPPPPRITGPRLSITPQDIANVKLRKTRDNPVRPKPVPKEVRQPLVTQHMLEKTRAKLGRTRPVASSTPKQQLTELEKCLLQESSVTSLYRRRVTRTNFRSAEELRVRPYPASRCTRSPLSPRSNSLSRAPNSPIKFPIFCPNAPNKD